MWQINDPADVRQLYEDLLARVLESGSFSVKVASRSEEVTSKMRRYFFGAIVRPLQTHLCAMGDEYLSTETLAVELKIRCGFVDTHIMQDGSVVYTPKSLSSTTKAERAEVCQFFKDCEKILWDKYAIGVAQDYEAFS